MLNRRHLRIKILHALYAYYQSEEKNVQETEKWLFKSINKFRELYIHLLLIFKSVREIGVEKIETRRKKILATNEDLIPNFSFVDNPIMVNLDRNLELIESSKNFKMSWENEKDDIVRAVYRNIENDAAFQEVLNGEGGDDLVKSNILKLFKKHIPNNDTIQHYIEEESVLWSDDLDLASSMAVKTLRLFNTDENPNISLLDLYKDPEDEIDFIKNLFNKTIEQEEENELLIQEKAQNWELERIAFMDMILMKMALAEAKTFESIPVKVTLNEFIEISKFYSTPKSSKFINGILDKSFQELKESGNIVKKGRGLIE
ncbi:MAG: transcription antitermination protein NusB [Bacteroidota bacterium]